MREYLDEIQHSGDYLNRLVLNLLRVSRLERGELAANCTLTDVADRISVGELGMEVKTTSKDEIGDLAEAISRMQDSIRLSIERLRRRR